MGGAPWGAGVVEEAQARGLTATHQAVDKAADGTALLAGQPYGHHHDLASNDEVDCNTPQQWQERQCRPLPPHGVSLHSTKVQGRRRSKHLPHTFGHICWTCYAGDPSTQSPGAPAPLQSAPQASPAHEDVKSHAGPRCLSPSQVRGRPGGPPPVRDAPNIYGPPGNSRAQQEKANRGTKVAVRNLDLADPVVRSADARGPQMALPLHWIFKHPLVDGRLVDCTTPHFVVGPKLKNQTRV